MMCFDTLSTNGVGLPAIVKLDKVKLLLNLCHLCHLVFYLILCSLSSEKVVKNFEHGLFNTNSCKTWKSKSVYRCCLCQTILQLRPECRRSEKRLSGSRSNDCRYERKSSTRLSANRGKFLQTLLRQVNLPSNLQVKRF